MASGPLFFPASHLDFRPLVGFSVGSSFLFAGFAITATSRRELSPRRTGTRDEPISWPRICRRRRRRPDRRLPHPGRTVPRSRCANSAATAYRQHDAASGRWVDWSWAQVAGEAERWRAAFAAEGFEPGARVATLMANSVAYVCVDQAALALGLAIAPLHVTDNPGNLAFILADSGAAALVIDNPEYWARLAPELRDHSDLQRVVVIAGPEAEIAADPRVARAEPWLAAAVGRAAPERDVSPQALAAIVYTSGTTGRPKGVMLSHGNIVANVLAVRNRRPVGGRSLSLVPAAVAYLRAHRRLLPADRRRQSGRFRSFDRAARRGHAEVRPTILISVPRIYERAYLAIQERLAAEARLARRLTRLAEQRRLAALRVARRAIGPARRRSTRAVGPVLDRLVARTDPRRLRRPPEASRSPAARRCPRRSRAASSRWASTCCRATA